MKKKDKERHYVTFAEDMLQAIRSGQIDAIISNNNELLKIQLAKTEEALKKSEIKYRSIFEHANDAIFFMDKTIFVDCNSKTVELFGCDNKKDIIGHHPWEYSPEFQSDGKTSKEKARIYIEKAFQGIPQRFEWLHSKKDGTLFNAEVSLNLVKINKNDYLLAVVRDITSKVKALKKIKESEELFRNLIHQSNDIIYLLYENRFEIINKKFTEVFGYTLEEVNKDDFNFMQIVSPKSRNVVLERMRKVKKGEKVKPIYNFIAVSKDGEEIYCEASVSYIPYKDGIATLGIIRDVTERKLAEEELQKLSSAVRQSPAMVVITDKNERIEYVNPTVMDITGYSKEELISATPRIFKSDLTPREAYTEMWEKLLAGDIWRGTFINKKKSGEIFYESAQIAPIFNDEGNITHFVKVGEDITKLKEYEQELILAKEKAEAADQLKSDFLAMISHEIRTPLNIILNYSSLIEEELKDRLMPEMVQFFNGIKTAGERIIRTVELILNLSEIQKGIYKARFEKIDINNLLKDLFNEYRAIANRKNIDFKLSHYEKAYIKADEYSVNQIFSNLIDNAIKYTSKGKVEISVFQNDEAVLVKVKDTGEGIKEEYLPYLFEPFSQEERGYTRRYEGNGLGLALVHEYCKLNNAFIQVESKKDKGSVFTVVFKK